jgi:hypothetical protein
MSARNITRLALALWPLVLGACKGSTESSESEQTAAPSAQEPAPPQQAVPTEAPAAEPPQAKAPAEPSAQAEDDQDKLPTREELPVAEDYEQEMNDAIEKKNYRVQLDALEKELKADAR